MWDSNKPLLLYFKDFRYFCTCPQLVLAVSGPWNLLIRLHGLGWYQSEWVYLSQVCPRWWKSGVRVNSTYRWKTRQEWAAQWPSSWPWLNNVIGQFMETSLVCWFGKVKNRVHPGRAGWGISALVIWNKFLLHAMKTNPYFAFYGPYIYMSLHLAINRVSHNDLEKNTTKINIKLLGHYRKDCTAKRGMEEKGKTRKRAERENKIVLKEKGRGNERVSIK